MTLNLIKRPHFKDFLEPLLSFTLNLALVLLIFALYKFIIRIGRWLKLREILVKEALHIELLQFGFYLVLLLLLHCFYNGCLDLAKGHPTKIQLSTLYVTLALIELFVLVAGLQPPSEVKLLFLI